MRGKEAEAPAAMRGVYRNLQRWRSKRQGRAPIPEPLWIAAGKLAREHGVNPVSRALGLEFNRLRQMIAAGAHIWRAMPNAETNGETENARNVGQLRTWGKRLRRQQTAGKTLQRMGLAPQVGFEPTTLRLTAECSTVELLRSNCRYFI